jgi:hypothetical protein
MDTSGASDSKSSKDEFPFFPACFICCLFCIWLSMHYTWYTEFCFSFFFCTWKDFTWFEAIKTIMQKHNFKAIRFVSTSGNIDFNMTFNLKLAQTHSMCTTTSLNSYIMNRGQFNFLVTITVSDHRLSR